ncbi:hypothetical protein [Micromonospora sp. Llam0]|uniref:hypothetical protein n=1 Tax=Micromonospora sp. Llam0 TaxID=2485143 RepID=UPI0011CE63FB|nr:hypothetical protein [Micromonospora sp. Llam0]
MSVEDVAKIIRQAAEELTRSTASRIGEEVRGVMTALTLTLQGAQAPDALAALAELRAAIDELESVRVELDTAAGECRNYLRAMGA